MIHPLRLRLRLVDFPETVDKPLILKVYAKTSPFAILEFENPLNGSWHPVEVVDDVKPD